MNYRDDNPCDRIGPVFGPQRDLVQHMPALPHREVAAAVEKVRASKAIPAVKLAFEFLVLTAAGSGEVRGARWAEIDTTDHVWTVPATRTKAKREHRVPLSGRAEQILDGARAVSDGGALVFPSTRGKRMNDMALSGLLKDLEIGAVPHGFRSTFRGLGFRGDEPPAGGRRGRAGAHRPEQGGGGLREIGPVRAAAPTDGRLGVCQRGDIIHFIAIAYSCICNRFPSSYPSFAIRCPTALKTLCGRLEIVDRRDDHALIRRCGAPSPPPPLSPNDDRASASDAYAWRADRDRIEPNRRAGRSCTSSGVRACSAAGAEPHATLDDAGTAETLLIQWQWWRRRESIRPEVHIS